MATSVRPTLSKIISRIEEDAESRLDAETLRRSDLEVYKRVLAGAAHELYSAIEYGRKQLFTETAEGGYLERRGSLFNVLRKTAVKSSGTVQFTWESEVEIPSGTVLQTSDGLQYATTSAVDSNGYATIKALIAGADYDLPVDTELTLVSPILGVSLATVTSAVTGGTDEETDDSLRERILAHTRNPPRTGTATDYVEWALEVPGVTRAWCYPLEMGLGTVTIRIMTDDLTDDGIPTDEMLTTVKEYIESKCNSLATIYVVAPVAEPVDFTLSITPDNLTIRARAEEALAELFKEEQVPGKGIYLSHINAALSAVTDEEDHVVVSPAADLEPSGTGYLLTLGDITWQES